MPEYVMVGQHKQNMKKSKKMLVKKDPTNRLFDRVVSILEQARANTVRAVNHNMTLAYWLIGREIVNELQGGHERAEYGKQLIQELSARLTHKYSKGFSTTNLWYFRQFYLVYLNRSPEILHPLLLICSPSCSNLEKDLRLLVDKSGYNLVINFSILIWFFITASLNVTCSPI